ncbi:esterase [Arthrobacter phage Seahorse]|uniref:Esterase n=1 Tax=Arthrobacter phage Seahorse TaxID=2419611 RepID=A0A3G3M533_9CAUD|nr:esterase [Arthrobacter phage Seahorse]AYR01533.1 esterase [Arthrobacter phage Seahorse]
MDPVTLGMAKADSKKNYAGALDLRRLELRGQSERLQAAANHRIDYDDTAIFIENWADLTQWSAAAQAVTANKLFYSSGSTAGTVHAWGLANTARARISTTITVPNAPGGTGFAFFGLNNGTPGGATPSGGNTIGIGVDPVTHYPIMWQGSSVGGAGASNLATTALAGGVYSVTVIADETSLSFVLADAAGNIEYRKRIDRSVINGINNLAIWLNDNRATNGISFGRIAARAGSATIVPRIPTNLSDISSSFSETWANLSQWTSGSQQVSAGKLYHSATVQGGTVPGLNRPVGGTLKTLTMTGSMSVPTGAVATSGLVLAGVATSTFSSGNLIAVGIDPTSGKMVSWRGSGVGGSSSVVVSSAAAQTGTHTFSITIDATNVVATITAPDTTTTFSLTVPLSGLTSPLANLGLWQSDNRDLTGVGIGSITANYTLPAGNAAFEGAAPSPLYTKPVSTSSSLARVTLPKNYDSRRPAPLVIWGHGHGRTAASAFDDSQVKPYLKAISDAGYIVASADAQGDAWGNAAAVTDYENLYRYVRDHYAITGVFLIATSMGGLGTLGMLANRNVPGILGWYGIAPVTSLKAIYDADYNGFFRAEVRTAYGIATDGSDYATKTAGRDPNLMAGEQFRGVPMRAALISDDTVVPPANHGTKLLAKVAPFAAEASTLTIATGGHIPDQGFNATDTLAFFARHQTS